jgi:hypothetical protein
MTNEMCNFEYQSLDGKGVGVGWYLNTSNTKKTV